jgi:2-polyprenyl-3-methyl-5-hydroxy-6-metoxy-1,4-benzoquinol methylase
MENCSCDLCGGSDHAVLWDKTEREKAGILRSVVIRDEAGNIIQGCNVMCKRCGLVYVSPRMSKEELDRFYTEDYRKIYGGGASLEAEERHAKTAASLLPLDREGFGGFLHPVKNHLDIGCSTGRLIEYTGGYGIEPNIRYYEIAKNKKTHYGIARQENLRVENCTIEDYNPGHKFDNITMLNALEHVLSPTAVLTKIHSFLNDGGHVLISVPNLLSTHINIPVDAFLSNAHLFNFTAATLGIMMRKCGLIPVKAWIIPEEMGEKVYMLAKKDVPYEIVFDDNIEKRIGMTKIFLHTANNLFALKSILNGGIR